MSTSIDLHMHSTASDGTKTPSELIHLILEYEKENPKVVALTDHDTVAGVQEFLTEAEKYKDQITAIAGVELSISYLCLSGKKQSIHILAYGIDPHNPEFLAALKKYRDNRDNRNVKIIKKLQNLGIPIKLEDIRAENPDDAIGRPNIARQLIKLGYVSSVHEGFEKYLGNGAPCYCDREHPDPKELISKIHACGGIAVLAHPYNYSKMTQEELLDYIHELMEYGLDGMEVYYSKNTPEINEYYEKLAKDLNLVATGGSDFHGENKPNISLFTGTGSLHVEEKILEPLMAKLDSK